MASSVEEDRTATLDDANGVRPRAPSTPPLAVGFPSGTVIGRYVVVRPLGQGGMGAVMLAFDTQLGRSVALKLMRTQVESDDARHRFVREAQAMARLSHPNVVGIYDVGVHEGNVFLAMEYVDGELLSAWLEPGRSLREIVAVMKQAAEGLRAAHDAGIVHRDFKPSNVLIAKDGRVCVFDFGIARTEGIEEPTVAKASASSGRRLAAWAATDSPSRLTEAGSMLGTVGYASPEQTLGEETDARSDVFSFTVTLWLALYGEKPFDSSSVEKYVLAVNAPALPARPAASKVPKWLHPILERGLAREPSRRFRSMSELLSAMGADPTRPRWRLVAAAAVLVGGALVALAFARHTARLHALCRAEGDAAPNAWAAKRGAVERALRTETDSFAAERTLHTLSTLDAYAASWRSVQVESCEATRIAKTQSEAVYDRRSQCLLERQMQLDVVADVLSVDDPELHHQSLAMASGLDAPALCTDAATSKTLLPLPSQPAARAKSILARRDLLRTQYPGALGFDGSERLAEQARDLAREANDARTEALAEVRVGTLIEKHYEYQKALETETHAYLAAEAIGQDSLGAAAALEIAFLMGQRMHRASDAQEWLALGRAKIARMGGAPALEVDALKVEADIEPDLRRALDLNARAIAATASTYGETSVAVCSLHNNRGCTYQTLGEPDKGAIEEEIAIDCQVRSSASSTDDHLIDEYINLAADELASGRGAETVASARRATELATARDADASIAALSLAVESLGLTMTGDTKESIRVADRAIAIAGRHADQSMATAQLALGKARLESGDANGARAACGRAAALDEKEGPAMLESMYDDLRCVGEAELAIGDVRRAREHLEPCASFEKRSEPGELALARFALARALVAKPAEAKGASPIDEAHATKLATQARDELRAVAARYPAFEPSLGRVERWLASRKR